MAAVNLPAGMDWKMAAVLVVGVLVAYRLVTRDAAAVAGAVGSGAVTAAKAVGGAVNPLQQNNLADATVDAITRATAGQTSGTTSLGQQIFAWTNPEEWKRLRGALNQ